MITKDKKEELIDHSIWIRKKIITMVINAGYGHIGGSLSCVDILCSLYLGKLLNVNPNNISANRDRYIHSKGHACEVMYATLARAGFIEKVYWKLTVKMDPFLVDMLTPQYLVSNYQQDL